MKTYYERGFGDHKNLPVIGPDVLAGIRKAATDDSLVLMMHANAFEAQKFATNGAVDVIAHGMWNWGKFNHQTEMQQLQKAGLSLAQIFRAATINNAREFKLESQLGTIEPGKIANLLLLRKSPLESLDAYDSIETVWVHGKSIARASLAEPQPLASDNH